MALRRAWAREERSAVLFIAASVGSADMINWNWTELDSIGLDKIAMNLNLIELVSIGFYSMGSDVSYLYGIC